MKCLGFGAEDDKVCFGACLPASRVGWHVRPNHPAHPSSHHLRRCTLSYCEANALIMTSALFLAFQEQKRASQSVAI